MKYIGTGASVATPVILVGFIFPLLFDDHFSELGRQSAVYLIQQIDLIHLVHQSGLLGHLRQDSGR